MSYFPPGPVAQSFSGTIVTAGGDVFQGNQIGGDLTINHQNGASLEQIKQLLEEYIDSERRRRRSLSSTSLSSQSEASQRAWAQMRKRLKAVGIKGVVLNDHEDAILACLHREIAGAEGGDNESEESSGDEASFRTFATSPPVPRIVVQNHISTVDYNYSPQHSASIWHRHSFKSGIKSISALFRHSPSTGARPQIDGIAQRLFTSNTKFLFAAANGDISEVKRVLASGAGPDVVAHENICGETALHVAAKHGHIEIVRLLCDFGVNLNANTTRVGASPLYYAVKYHQIAAVKLLLDYGAGPFVGRESLDIIINMDGRELLETFMDAMEDIELWYEYILFQATSQKRKSIIQAVLDRGSRSNLRFGSEFLDIVIQGGDCSILLQLLGGALDPCHVSDADGMSCLSRAARRGNESMVQALISYGADPQVTDISGKTPLHEAARWGSLETMQLLIESGADVNALDGHGRSPLHAAIGGAIPSLVNNILALLFLNGVRPETLDHDGMAALHVAVKQGDEGVVEALLDLGASVLTVDGSGETPLGLALSAIEPDPNLISLLRREEKKWGSTSGLISDDFASHYLCYQNVFAEALRPNRSCLVDRILFSGLQFDIL